MKNIFAAVAILLLMTMVFGCGGGSGGGLSLDVTGSAKIVVRNSRSKDGSKDYGAVNKYTVSIYGEGMSEPIEAEFEGDAENGVIEGVPSGGGKTVTVTAINKDDRPIRQGEAEEVNVASGGVTEVEVKLEAVPIFANLYDGNIVKNTRLRFELFADPEDPLHVEEVLSDKNVTLFDAVSNLEELLPDANTGIAVMVPQNIKPGEHQFKVLSARTGRSSSVKIKVVDGADVKPAPLYSGGMVEVCGDFLKVNRLGSPLASSINSSSLWPQVLNQQLINY